MQAIIETVKKPAISALKDRGYFIVYHEDRINFCPGCGKTHWHIGRTMAECAFCETALPLEAAPASGQADKIVRMDRQNHAAARGRFVVNQKIC